jgi:hypothetical protein
VAYRAEIEIGVKGVKQLDRFQSQLERLSNEVDRVNKKKFTVGNLSSYNEALRKANETLNQTEIETSKAGKATGLYKKNLNSFVTALLASNSAQDLNNKLVRQEIQDRGAATQALKSYNAELAATTQRGAQTTMVGSYLRGQPKFGPEPAPGFDPVAGAARTRASGLAADAIAKGRATEQAAQEEIRLVGKVNQADRRAFITLNNEKIRLEQKRIDLTLDGIEAGLAKAIKGDKEIGANFDKRLTARIQATENAESAEKRIQTQRLDNLQAVRKIEESITKERLINSKKTAKARKDALGSAIIGGGFPLLFGQGPAAALGGALGGGAGGLMGGQFGFGLSLIGTQLGVVIDGLISDAASLGEALTSVTANIDAVVAASGKTNTTFAKNVKALEEAGLKNTALELATKELANVVGTDGVNSLKEFSSDTAKLSAEFAKAMSIMQVAVVETIQTFGLLKGLLGGLEETVLEGQIQRELKKGGPDAERLRASMSRPDVGSDVKTALTDPASIIFGKKPLNTAKDPRFITPKTIRIIKQINVERALNNTNASQNALKEKKNLDLAKQNLNLAEQKLKPGEILKQFTDKQKEQEKAQLNFDARRNGIVANYEKSIGDLRRNIEGQVSTLRLQNLQKANQLEDQRAANALAGLRNQQAASSLFTAGTGGIDPALRGDAESLKNAANAYELKVVEAEQKRAKLERDATLTVQEIQFRADKFKLDVARQAAELGLNTQKQIDRINKTIVERNSKLDAARFNTELNIAKLRLQILRREIAFENQKLKDAQRTAPKTEQEPLSSQRASLSELDKDLKNSVETLNKAKPPEALTEVQGFTQAGVDLTEYNKLVGVSIGLQDKLKQSRLDAISGDLEAAGLDRLKASADILIQIQNQAVDALAARNIELDKSARLSELTAELGSQALAQEITNIEFATSLQEKKIGLIEANLTAQQSVLEAKIAEGTANETEIAQLEQIERLLREINKLKGVVATTSASLKKGAKGEIDQFIQQSTNELNNFQALAVRVSKGIGDAVGNSLANGISGLIEGSATVKDVFADMLKSIGQTLVQEGTKMIATYIAIGIAKAFAGMSGGVTSGKGVNLGQNPNFFQQGPPPLPPIPGQANGGPVSGGQPYMVGERGPELFVPGQSGGVMRNEDMRSLMGRSPASGGAASMNFSFETTSIGGTEYVSREQLESAMAVTRKQASNDGAKRGMSMTLDKMQNSPRTRSKIGLR